jgi:hypothetical protein
MTQAQADKLVLLWLLTGNMTPAQQEEFFANLANVMNMPIPQDLLANLTERDKAILNLTQEESKNNLRKLLNTTKPVNN